MKNRGCGGPVDLHTKQRAMKKRGGGSAGRHGHGHGNGGAPASGRDDPGHGGDGEGKLRIHLKRSCTDRKLVQQQGDAELGLTTDGEEKSCRQAVQAWRVWGRHFGSGETRQACSDKDRQTPEFVKASGCSRGSDGRATVDTAVDNGWCGSGRCRMGKARIRNLFRFFRRRRRAH